MKKNVIRVISIVLLVSIIAACCLGFAGCSAKEKMFGRFRCYGHYLVQKGVKTIDSIQAKTKTWKLASGTETAQATKAGFASTKFTAEEAGDSNVKATPKAVVESIMTKYSGFTTTTIYYEVDSNANKAKEVSKTDEYLGDICESTLLENKLAPYAQMVANNIIAYDGLIDWMDERNAIFNNSPDKHVYPFSSPYSYWTDSNDNLVIQTHKYINIDANYTGGISCYYMQDSEIVYDSEGKLSLWQTSLGVAYASTAGTGKEGFIMTIQFDWTPKE